MNKTEKIIAAVATMAFGVLLIVLQGKFIGLLMTVAGICLIVWGVLDFLHHLIPPAVIKIVAAVLIIVCGWALVEAVLYIAAALLLIAGILMLYDKIKKRVCCDNWYFTVLEYAVPALFILIGLLLLFHQAATLKVIFVICGILTIIDGGLLLADAFLEDME